MNIVTVHSMETSFFSKYEIFHRIRNVGITETPVNP